MNMRTAARAQRVAKHRSWTASFVFNKHSSKAVKLARFASPPTDIRAAVQEMRLVRAAERAKHQRSWSASFALNKIHSKKPQLQRFACPAVDIQTSVAEMRMARAAVRASRVEAAAKEDEQHAAEVDCLILEEEIRELSKQAEAAREAKENEALIAEELSSANNTPSKAAAEKLSPSPIATYLAGSPAAAMRQLRRSVPTFQMDADGEKRSRGARESDLTRAYSAIGAQFFSLDDGEDDETEAAKPTAGGAGVRSAMEMDLDCKCAAPISRVPKDIHQTSFTKVSKSTPSFVSLRPLVASTSAAFIQHVASKKSSGHVKSYGKSDVSAWRVDRYPVDSVLNNQAESSAWGINAATTLVC
jgi:hypothetical protein